MPQHIYVALQKSVPIDMRDVMIIKDPKIAKLLADKTRRDILRLLSIRELSICQIAKILNKNISSIVHHIKKLERAGLVELSRKSVKGNVVEKFYRASARRFIVSFSLESEEHKLEENELAKWIDRIATSVAKALPSFGFELSDEEEELAAQKIKKLLIKQQKALEKVALRQKTQLSTNGCVLSVLLRVISYTVLFEDKEFLKALNDLRELLFRGDRS